MSILVSSTGSCSTIVSSTGKFSSYYTSDPQNIFTQEATDLSLGTDHAIAIVGWGTNYWIIANSWGPYWGYNGYAKVQMGIRQLGSSAYFCQPLID